MSKQDRAIEEMDKPLNDAADLSRALVMALASAGGAGFSEVEDSAALETLARYAQDEVQRSLYLWNRSSTVPLGRPLRTNHSPHDAARGNPHSKGRPVA